MFLTKKKKKKKDFQWYQSLWPTLATKQKYQKLALFSTSETLSNEFFSRDIWLHLSFMQQKIYQGRVGVSDRNW